MSDLLHIEQSLPFSTDRVFEALTTTEGLEGWFAEHADVSIDDGRLAFWGRFTPGTPSRAEGSGAITAIESDRTLRFEWTIDGHTTDVEIELVPRGEETVLVFVQRKIPPPSQAGLAQYAMEDFWFLSFENLLRHLAGRAIVRCDFGDEMRGRIEHTVTIEGSPESVWRAITDPKQLERWIASTADISLEPNGVFDLGWGEGFALMVRRIEANRLLELDWPGETEPTTLRFELEPVDSGTRLKLVHEGFPPDMEVGGIWVGWLHFVAWIASVVEFGSDWAPAVKEIGESAVAMYAASQVARQKSLERHLREDGVKGEAEAG